MDEEVKSTNQRFRKARRFNLSEFTNGAGVWLVWMTVPNPGTIGSSPDFRHGPIIPNSLFPIHVKSLAFHNDQRIPDVGEFDVLPLESWTPPFSVDGHSHFPIFLADNADFVPMPNLRGSYEYRPTLIDPQGNGWLVVAKFAVGLNEIAPTPILLRAISSSICGLLTDSPRSIACVFQGDGVVFHRPECFLELEPSETASCLPFRQQIPHAFAQHFAPSEVTLFLIFDQDNAARGIRHFHAAQIAASPPCLHLFR